MINVKVNGEEREIEEATTISKLIEVLEVNPKGIAVEVNSEIVPRRTHGEAKIKDGDKIEIVRMVGGG